MNIQTRFNVGDTVWYYIEHKNMYASGAVEQIDVRVGVTPQTRYMVKNDFYKEDPYASYLLVERDQFEYHRSLDFQGMEVFATPEELKKNLHKKHLKKMDQLSELKKGWW